MKNIIITLILLSLILTSCKDPAIHTSKTLKEDISEFIINKHNYDGAIKLLESINISKQVKDDIESGESTYFMIGEDLIVTPGIIEESVKNGWYVPGTSDAIIDKSWQETATIFAEKYNKLRKKWVTKK